MLRLAKIRNWRSFVSAAVEENSAFGKRLEGKVAVVTGGASGVGEGTARLFLQHGARVVIADIQDELGGKVAEELGKSARYVHCDIAKEEDVAKTVDLAVETYGKLDIMFNNAALNCPQLPFGDMTADFFNRCYQVNVRGAFLGVKHAARVMIPNKSGCILNTGSVGGMLAMPFIAPYTISKAAIHGLTTSAASELGRYGIRVNTISPGPIATPMFLKGFLEAFPHFTMDDVHKLLSDASLVRGSGPLKPQGLAQAALFLATHESSYTSGCNLVIDAGHAAFKGWDE